MKYGCSSKGSMDVRSRKAWMFVQGKHGSGSSASMDVGLAKAWMWVQGKHGWAFNRS